jgi:hypothetical protein
VQILLAEVRRASLDRQVSVVRDFGRPERLIKERIRLEVCCTPVLSKIAALRVREMRGQVIDGVGSFVGLGSAFTPQTIAVFPDGARFTSVGPMVPRTTSFTSQGIRQ